MKPVPKVLIVEDERALALAFAAAVRQAGAASELAPTAAQARRKLREAGPFDAIILDIGLPDENGLAFLESLPATMRLPVIVVTAHGEIGNTINARKLGVREFFTKPLDFESFTTALADLLRETPRHANAPDATPGTGSGESADSAFIGAAPAMRSVFRQIAHACASDEPVLVRGATGTGKTRVAHLLRQHSAKGTGSLVVHAAEAGSVGGALANAVGGFLLIENLAALPSADQGTLLGRMESADREFPRLVATCGPDLHEAVTRGDFRSDLYYRLQVMEVRLPTLRDRREDIPVLAEFFAGQLAPGRLIELTAASLKILAAHDWPGNLRELRNVISYALTAAAGAARIDPGHLPAYLLSGPAAEEGNGDGLPQELSHALHRWIATRLRGESLPAYDELAGALETALLRELLPHFDGKLARLATALQANRATLRRKLRDGKDGQN
jgi:DNA-binding NtrC family response regulator